MDPHPHTPQKKKKRKPTETLWSSDLITTSKNSYCRAVETLVDWCKDNHLLLNVSKTKKIVVDFRRDPPTPCTLLFNGEEVKMLSLIHI